MDIARAGRSRVGPGHERRGASVRGAVHHVRRRFVSAPVRITVRCGPRRSRRLGDRPRCHHRTALACLEWTEGGLTTRQLTPLQRRIVGRREPATDDRCIDRRATWIFATTNERHVWASPLLHGDARQEDHGAECCEQPRDAPPCGVVVAVPDGHIRRDGESAGDCGWNKGQPERCFEAAGNAVA